PPDRLLRHAARHALRGPESQPGEGPPRLPRDARRRPARDGLRRENRRALALPHAPRRCHARAVRPIATTKSSAGESVGISVDSGAAAGRCSPLTATTAMMLLKWPVGAPSARRMRKRAFAAPAR